MNPSVDPTELLAAQRALRDRILGAPTAPGWRPARDLAAEMLLYLDQPQACWRTCLEWLMSATCADRIDAGFASSGDACYRPAFERVRADLHMPSVLGSAMDARDPGIATVWSSRRVVVFANVEADRRLGPSARAMLLAAGTRRKLAVALRDAGRDVGLLCVDGGSALTQWTADECQRLDSVAREVIGPILGASRRLGRADRRTAESHRGQTIGIEHNGLTPAELRVARLVVAGCSYKEIARRLDRSSSTIDHQLRSMREKLGVNSTAKLMRELVGLLPVIEAMKDQPDARR